jgi:predicted RNA-binding Zn ribbon-like protein
MVKNDDLPSRATTLTLVGGELALDFANTASGRGAPDRREHLQAPGDVADWAAHARVLPPEDADWLKEAARADPALGDRLLQSALTLREDIYVLGAELAAGRAPPPEPIDRVRALHAHCLERARLAPFGQRFAWNWNAEASPIESVLGPVSLSALTTLLQADLTRIKQCQGDKCGWLFLDSTKNKSRRWCEMEVCGNRAKQKRLASKARGA